MESVVFKGTLERSRKIHTFLVFILIPPPKEAKVATADLLPPFHSHNHPRKEVWMEVCNWLWLLAFSELQS